MIHSFSRLEDGKEPYSASLFSHIASIIFPGFIMMKKSPFILLMSFLLAGCSVAPYVPPTTDNVAYLTIPKTSKSYSLLGGFSGQNVGVGMLKEDGCIGAIRAVNPVKPESLNANGELEVVAGKPIVLSASSNIGNNMCGVMGAVTLEKDKRYVFSFVRSLKSCSIHLSEEGKTGYVSMKKLHDKITKMCVE